MIGPSTVSRELINPKPPVVFHFLALPSFSPMFSTELTRPPYSAGMDPLMRSMFLMASALKTLKNPNRCEALYTVASSRRMRFWSGPPPRT